VEGGRSGLTSIYIARGDGPKTAVRGVSDMNNPRLIGDWIADRYEIFDIISGGMGDIHVVYDHQATTGPKVMAIKALREQYYTDPRYSERFVNECRTWIKLDRHPNVVRAYSVQEIDSHPHVFLELVTGGDLRHWIGTPRLDLIAALRFAIQFCSGMEYSLQKGLHCHRDIKPENLLITEGGTLKITDFGLAKIHDEGGGFDFFGGAIPLSEVSGPHMIIYSDSDTSEIPTSIAAELEREPFSAGSTRRDRGKSEPAGGSASTMIFPKEAVRSALEIPLADDSGFNPPSPADDSSAELNMNVEAPTGFTKPNAALGTGPYMAPEQFVDAKSVDFRADMYGFGVVFFEMITGERPFRGKKIKTLCRQHMTLPPPSLVPAIPKKYARHAARIDAIAHRCLEKTPSKRYPSFADLRRDLAECLWEIARRRVPVPRESELDAWDLTNKGISLGTLGRHLEEKSCYEEAIASASKYVPAWFNMAACMGDLGRFEKAIQAADVALKINRQSLPALINKALALCVLERGAEAWTLVDRPTKAYPRDPDLWYARGVAALALGDFHASADSFDKSLRLRPIFEAAALARGAVKRGDGIDRIVWTRRSEDTVDDADRG
jgi:serine/threonine protein kinase